MVVYPAIFHKSVEGGYVVVFPDFDYGATEGKSLEEAMEMAEDYIGTWLYDDFVNNRKLTVPSKLNDISIEISEDEKEFLRKLFKKSPIIKNSGINFRKRKK